MTRPVGPSAVWSGEAGAAFAVLGLCWVPVLLGLVLWTGGQLASVVSGHGLAPVRPDVAFGTTLLAHGPAAPWPQTPPALVWTATVVVVAAVALPAAFVGRLVVQLRSGGRSLAGPRELGSLTGRAAVRRARQLRPRLLREVSGPDVGISLGRFGRAAVRASWEDVVLAVMAPRAGKTTSLAVPAILAAPGAVIATSNKADLWTATAALRAERTGQRVWVFDPQQITYAEQTWWWNPLRGVTTVEEAHRLAGHFVQEIRGGSRHVGSDFWTSAAHDLLTSLLLAAACGGRDLVEVYEWLNDPVLTTPV
ncbi:MAG TPA: type IV secretory system conjugative DNA transfer family protein, partial [Kineosporiaceae bacterium]